MINMKSSENIESLFDEITNAILDTEKVITEVNDDFHEQVDKVMAQAYPYLMKLCELNDTNIDALVASGSSLREANEEAYYIIKGMYA